jgi:hypothetical protein
VGSEADTPGLTTRRDFLKASAAAGALLTLPELAGCGSSNDQITRVAIHPAIGIARVGNSADSFFFGPEVPGALPHAVGGFKDAHGAVARQVARFRVFGLDRNGRVVRELTAADAQVTWQVNVANSKAAWYEFDTAFDIPGAVPGAKRNPAEEGGARARLAVAPPGRAVSGKAAGPVALDGGSFLGEAVPLGELMTDGAGRLVFLPAQGRGYSPGSTPLGSFSENPGWTDDVCDGPVRATVKLGGRTLEAEPAWVLVTPPNYAPAMAHGVVTAYDAARSALVDARILDGGPVSFAEDILPIFARLVDLQWVSAGFFEMNGFGSSHDWTAGGMPDRLADRSRANAAFRRSVFASFRSPSFQMSQPNAVPEEYGDAISFKKPNPRAWLAVTTLQYRKLAAWANGGFVDDRPGGPQVVSIEKLPLQQRPEALDRAALESCLGGAFHPGIEAPWTVRVPSLWQQPFRLKVRSASFELQDYGPELTRQKVFAAGGPVDGVGPGDLTRWLGVPWHADGASCRSGYQRRISTVLPTFWPARIPTQVLSEADYRIVLDRSRPMAERQAAFRRRRDWERFIARPTRPPTLELMVREWPKLGMVSERPGPGDPEFPQTFKVESYVGFGHEPKHEYGADLWVPQVS